MSELNKYITPNSIEPKTPYIGFDNLKADAVKGLSSVISEPLYLSIEDLSALHKKHYNEFQKELTLKLDSTIFTTYDRLKIDAINGNLKQGQSYCITDYNTLVSQPGISSMEALLADYPIFVINLLLVDAITPYQLSEDAKLLRLFDVRDGKWTSNMQENLGHLREIQEIDVKYDPYWDYDFEKSKVHWVPQTAYDTNTGEKQGVFFAKVKGTDPTSACPILFADFLTYTGVNFYGKVGEGGTPQKFWEFACGNLKYYLLSDRLRNPDEGEPVYIMRTLSTEVGGYNVLSELEEELFYKANFTGYIYHAKDRWGNEASYDFGCVLKSTAYMAEKLLHTKFPESYAAYAKYFRTHVTTVFSWRQNPVIITPFYYKGGFRNNVVGRCNHVPSVIFVTPETADKSAIDYNFVTNDSPDINREMSFCREIHIGENSHDVFITCEGTATEYIVIGDRCQGIISIESNKSKIGEGCISVSLIESSGNVIGDRDSDVVITSSHDNTISNYCQKISMEYSNLNRIGSNCGNIVLGRGGVGNVIEDDCHNIHFGKDYIRNTIHSGSSEISFRSSNSVNASLLDRVRFCNIGKNCTGAILYYPSPMSDNDYVQNIEVEDGIKLYQIDEYKFIRVPVVNNTYKIRVGNDSRDVTQVWNDADIIGNLADLRARIAQLMEIVQQDTL